MTPPDAIAPRSAGPWTLTSARHRLRSARAPFAELRGGLFIKYVALFVAVVCVALLAIGTLQIWLFSREHRASLIRIQHEQAEAAAAKIGQFVTEIEAQLGWTTQLSWNAGTLEQRRFDARRLLRQVPAVTELAQIDPSGRERLRVSRLATDVVGSDIDVSGEPRFLEPLAGRTHYGPIYFRRASEPYMTLAIGGARRENGVSVAEVNLKFIWDVVSRIKVGDQGKAYVVDGLGRLIAHPDISLVLRNINLSELAQVQAAKAEASGAPPQAVHVAADLQGREVLTAHAPVAPLGWTVFVELPSAEAYAPLYAAIRRTTLLLLAALALAGLAGMLLARRMVGPIKRLQAGAARIGGGDLTERIAIRTGDELESLADQFNDMARRLSESYAGLEHKVESRTRELAQSVQELQALGEIAQAVNSTLDLQTVLSTIVAKAVRISEADAGAIYEFDAARQIFRLSATDGMDEAVIVDLRGQTIDFSESNIARAVREREPIQIPDMRAEPPTPVRDIVIRAGYRALLIAPLLRPDEEVLGILVVRRKAPGTFPRRAIELLETFAAQSVLAIQNARLFSEVDEKSRQLAIESRHKSQFLANMSHELRTPLNAVLGYTELMLDNIYGEMPDKARRVLGRIETNARHLLGLINDVLDLSKIEAGQLTLSIGDYSMTDLVEGVITAVEPLAAAKGLGVRAEIEAALPRARGDERRMAQVLLNLVGNAIKFTDDGAVTITAAAADGWFTVAVRDTGAGVSEEDQSRIFDEFQQADSSSTRRKGGTGLGLSIARRIVEVHGGRIWVRSSPGQGSTFFFSVPVTVDRQAGPP